MKIRYYDDDKREWVDITKDHEVVSELATMPESRVASLAKLVLILLDRVDRLEWRNDQEDTRDQERGER